MRRRGQQHQQQGQVQDVPRQEGEARARGHVRHHQARHGPRAEGGVARRGGPGPAHGDGRHRVLHRPDSALRIPPARQ